MNYALSYTVKDGERALMETVPLRDLWKMGDEFLAVSKSMTEADVISCRHDADRYGAICERLWSEAVEEANDKLDSKEIIRIVICSEDGRDSVRFIVRCYWALPEEPAKVLTELEASEHES